MNPHQSYKPKSNIDGNASEYLSRSLEINAIWTYDTEFQLFSINHAHIILSSL